MKTQKIVLNVIFICIILALIGVLAVNAGSNAPFKFPYVDFGRSAVARPLISGGEAQFNANFDADEISSINLNFADENIVIENSFNDAVSIELVSPAKLSDADKMRCKLNNGALYVESGRFMQNAGCLGAFNLLSRDITVKVKIPVDRVLDASLNSTSGRITVPARRFGEFSCASVSGDVNASGGAAANASFSTTSGNVTARDIACKSLDASSVSGVIKISADADGLNLSATSGGVSFTGSARAVVASTVSGDLNLELSNPADIDAESTSGDVEVICNSAAALDKLSARTISGDVTLRLPENDGFALNFETISGESYNEAFEMLGDKYKNGGAEIEVETTSGSMRIEKLG